MQLLAPPGYQQPAGQLAPAPGYQQPRPGRWPLLRDTSNTGRWSINRSTSRWCRAVCWEKGGITPRSRIRRTASGAKERPRKGNITIIFSIIRFKGAKQTTIAGNKVYQKKEKISGQEVKQTFQVGRRSVILVRVRSSRLSRSCRKKKREYKCNRDPPTRIRCRYPIPTVPFPTPRHDNVFCQLWDPNHLSIAYSSDCSPLQHRSNYRPQKKPYQ